MSAYEQRQLAEGTIRLAVQRAAQAYPFHAAVLERFVLATRSSIRTMAVSVFDKRIHLWHHPPFVLGLPMDQLVGVLIHEVNHVVLGHIWLDPADFPDHWAQLVAAEITANEYLREPLPPGCVLLEHFPDLPADESTRRRYDRLAQAVERIQVMTLAEFSAQGGRLDRPIQDSDGKPILLVPDEEGPADPSDNTQEAKDAVQDLLADAALAVGTGNIPQELRGPLSEMGIGTKPGSDSEPLRPHGGRLQWARLLRRYVGQGVAVRSDLHHPPRRMPHLVGIVPGRRRLSGRPRILAVIDTSASMSQELLGQISGELSRLVSDYRVTVVECDAKIQATYVYKPLRTVLGRGGTDLRPPLARAFLRKHRADLVIYFTDGDGPVPRTPPPLPLIWCLTPDGEAPAEWGKIVRMDESTAPQGLSA